MVFNIGGNKYRVICRYHFGNSRVHLFVNWIGTHADYTKLCNERKQYDEYCNTLENLIVVGDKNVQDEIELLNLLIEKWDIEHNSFTELDPVELIKVLMDENRLKSKDLVEILDLSKGTVSKILNYHKGLSKETIRKLSQYFKVRQDILNRPYRLVNKANRYFSNASLMNTKKNMGNIIAV